MAQRKKIVHLITGLEVGGAETMLLKTLPKTKDDFDHLVCSIIGVGPVGDALQAAGITVHNLNLSGISDIAIFARFKKLIGYVQPDALITYLPHADLFGRIIGHLCHVPTIVSSIRVRLHRSKYLPFFIVDGLTSPLVTHYHFNSHTIAAIHHHYLSIPYRKITVIPNAVEIQKYDIHIDTTAKKKELKIPDNKLVVGCVARLRKQKGHKYLIGAFHHLLQHKPNTVLALVGDGEEKINITKQISDLKISDRVILLGNRHDVPEILQTFDIFALTTLFEGMSNSLLEAMSAHRPIVTSDIPENRELIKHRKTGILVPAKNMELISQSLIELIDNALSRKQYARAAYQTARQRFSTEKVIPKYKRFYASL